MRSPGPFSQQLKLTGLHVACTSEACGLFSQLPLFFLVLDLEATCVTLKLLQKVYSRWDLVCLLLVFLLTNNTSSILTENTCMPSVLEGGQKALKVCSAGDTPQALALAHLKPLPPSPRLGPLGDTKAMSPYQSGQTLCVTTTVLAPCSPLSPGLLLWPVWAPQH